jgi:cytoskeletal protein RodZ
MIPGQGELSVPSFGMRLRQEREKKSVTLDDISLSTKISTRMLRALEEERFDQLPGGIFNKGFIRAYARCLGMDEEQAIADYLTATGVSLAKPSESDEQAPILEPPPREQDSSAGLPWGRLALALLIVALGFAAWGYYSRESQKGTQESAASTPVPNMAPAPVAEPSPSQPPTDSNAAPAELAKPSQPTVSSAAAGASSQTPAASPSVSTPNQPPPPRTTGFTVLIKARQDSWLAIAVDGEVSTQSILAASSQKSVRASEEIVIRAGNIGGLDFEFNGKKLPVQGDLGEVKTLTFNAHGLQPPAPKPDAPAP